MNTQTIFNDYVKLDAPLEDVLPRITVIVPEKHGKDGKPLEVIIGKSLKGKAEFMSDGETHELEYTLLNEHVVEGKRYIVTVVSYNFGGDGTFYYLIGIDKSTLKSVSELFLGDRVRGIRLRLRDVEKDTVDITYSDREQRKAFAENPHHIRHSGIAWVVGPPGPPQSFDE